MKIYSVKKIRLKLTMTRVNRNNCRGDMFGLLTHDNKSL